MVKMDRRRNLTGLSLAFFVIFLVSGVIASATVETRKYLPKGVKEIRVGNFRLTESLHRDGIAFSIDTNDTIPLSGQLGVALPSVVDSAASVCGDPEGADECLEWGDYAKLKISAASQENDNCVRIEWVSSYGRRLEDCFDLVEGQHWYGGIQLYYQTFPIEGQEQSEMASVSGSGFGGVNENYWFTTNGAAVHVDEDVPLFTSLNSVHKGQFCLVAKDVHPYVARADVRLNYNLCAQKPGENLLDLHRRSLSKYYPTPVGTPDLNMLVRPFWSTWAQFHQNINEQIVLNFAQQILNEGFQLNSHVEIDDNWESCYGEAEFDSSKFPDPAGLVSKLKEMGFKVTMWIHPFINFNCPSFKTAFENNYFIRDAKDKPAITSWWAGGQAGIIDFSNENAVTWWTGRLERLRQNYGIDSFKFDAGEYDSLPYSVKMNGDSNLIPNLHTKTYVEAVAPFGGMIEVRVGRGNQREAIFTRMIDKDSRWGYDNGLKSVIPTLLHFSMLGYSFCLPDMIGGNAYGGRPSKDLYVRWMQTNVLMPAVQISIVPWEFDAETIQLSLQVLAIREGLSEYMKTVAQESVSSGLPMNRPMWFSDPEDFNLYDIDNQYMLGDDVIVAPVVDEGAVTRNIYLPTRDWDITVDTVTTTYTGPILLNNFSTPLNLVPIFVRANNQHNIKSPNVFL